MADSGALPTSPIDPIPRILADPVFHADTNTLDLVISDLHTPDPLEVYLGPIGPLGVSTWQSTAPAGNSVSSSEYPATPLDDVAKTGERVMSAFPSSVQHVIVLVEMPNPEQIIRTMQECVAAEGPSNSEQADSRDDAAIQESTPWLRGTEEHKLEVEELIIQEALRNAENGSTDGYCLTSLPLDGGNDIIIDPTLQMEDEQRQRVQLEVDGKPATQSHSKDRHPPLIALTRRRVRESCHEMVPLPLLLVRRSDGVGFGTGRSVAAERLGVGKVSRSGSARWGECSLHIGLQQLIDDKDCE